MADDLISKRIDKIGKKIGNLIDDIEVLYRAQIFEVTHENTGIGVATQLQSAGDKMRSALYCISLAKASAEGEEIVGQMKANLDGFAKVSGEGGES